MPLELQDPKLRLDYTRLSGLPYVFNIVNLIFICLWVCRISEIEMLSFQQYGDHSTERYSLVWASLIDKEDPLVRRCGISASL
jgi:hypothetical protein